MTPWGHNGVMADVKIRKLPDWVVAAYKAQAEHAGRSLEEELRILLVEGASNSRKELLREVRAFRTRLRRKYGVLPDSTPGIREDREARG
jgi:plasmid stability protein